MRKMVISFLVAALVAFVAGDSWAGKGGNGNGGGGNGGGGGGDPVPDGRVYFLRRVAGFNNDTVRSVLADGANESLESIPQSVTPSDGHISYARHGGDEVYWSLGIKVTQPVANPDGTAKTVVVARRDGSEIELTTPASGGENVTAVRWGKADAFISYVAVRWTGTGASDAEAHVYTAAVSWATGEPVLTETPVQQFEVPTFLDPYNETPLGNVLTPKVAYFDWSPDGTEVAYELEGEIWVRELGAAAPSAAVRAGTGPAWSPDGSTLAFKDSGLWTMNPDGTNATQLVADGGKDTVYGPIAWSPDGADLAFMLGKPRRSVPSGLGSVDFDLARVAAGGGDPVLIVKDRDSDDYVAEWRAD